MEQTSHNGQFVVLAKGNWKTKTNNGYTFRDNDVKGTVDIEFSKLSGKSLVSVDKLTLDIFPGVPSTSAQSITVPDFLGAVTGNRFCFVYSTEKNQRLFVVYEIDDSNKKVSVKTQFVIDSQVAPTAIMAIKDKVFLGFPGQVGVVDLMQPSLSLNLFHNWQEQTWGKNSLKTIDAFAFDSTQPDSDLVAVDDVVWPKYAFTYKINGAEPKNSGKFDLPTGANEHYKDAVKTGNRLILTAKYGHRGGQGNRIQVLEGTKSLWSISEHAPWDHDDAEDLELFVGTKFTEYSSVGLLNGNVILVSAGTRGVIAIPIDQIKKEKKTMYGRQYDVHIPHGVRRMHVGTSAAEVVTVKDKSVAFILGTTDTNRTVLNQVRWNEQNKDIEVVHSEYIEGVYERLFMEI